MRNFALALVLTLASLSVFASTPAQLCHQEIWAQHEASVASARTAYQGDMQRCFDFPYESDRYIACEGDAQMRLQAATNEADAAYALARRDCNALL